MPDAPSPAVKSPASGKKPRSPTTRITDSVVYVKKGMYRAVGFGGKKAKTATPDAGVHLLPQPSATSDASASLSPTSEVTASPLDPKLSSKTRSQLAAFLYHMRESEEERDAALLDLEAKLQECAPPAWKRITHTTPSIASLAPTAAEPRSSTFWRSEPPPAAPAPVLSTAADPAANAAATRIQAQFKGRRERKSLAAAAGLAAELSVAAAAPAAASAAPPSSSSARAMLLASGVVGVAGIVLGRLGLPPVASLLVGIAWRLACYAAAAGAGLYAWIRAPHWLGWVLTQVRTHAVLHGRRSRSNVHPVHARAWCSPHAYGLCMACVWPVHGMCCTRRCSRTSC